MGGGSSPQQPNKQRGRQAGKTKVKDPVYQAPLHHVTREVNRYTEVIHATYDRSNTLLHTFSSQERNGLSEACTLDTSLQIPTFLFTNPSFSVSEDAAGPKIPRDQLISMVAKETARRMEEVKRRREESSREHETGGAQTERVSSHQVQTVASSTAISSERTEDGSEDISMEHPPPTTQSRYPLRRSARLKSHLGHVPEGEGLPVSSTSTTKTGTYYPATKRIKSSNPSTNTPVASDPPRDLQLPRNSGTPSNSQRDSNLGLIQDPECMELAHRLEKTSLATLTDETTKVELRKRPEVNYLGAQGPSPPISTRDLGPGEANAIVYMAIFTTPSMTHRRQELALSASQPLSAVLEVLDCLSGEGIPEVLLEDEANSSETKLSNEGAFLFVEGIFYNDTRARLDGSIPEDMSRKIIEWASEPGREGQVEPPGPYSTGDLETPLGHVPLRFGVPYLLCHQGHCEHYISFLDAKITHASAIRDSENPYPMVLFRGKLARHRCRICNNYPAEYVTINDVMSGETPCFFCQYCFEPFHCDSQGNSLGQYQVFPYNRPEAWQQNVLASLRKDHQEPQDGSFPSNADGLGYSEDEEDEEDDIV